jgi:hypothetical protein
VRVWLGILLLVILLFVVGAFVKFLLIVAAIVLVLWLIGFAVGRSRGRRWYRW